MFHTVYDFYAHFASCSNLNPLGQKGFYGTKNTITRSQKHFQATLAGPIPNFPIRVAFRIKVDRAHCTTAATFKFISTSL